MYIEEKQKDNKLNRRRF